MEVGEGYPGWKMNPESEILKIAVETYKALFGKRTESVGDTRRIGMWVVQREVFRSGHGVVRPDVARGKHSPDERLLIPTVATVWDHIKSHFEEYSGESLK